MTVTDNLNCLYHDIINQEIINKYKKIFKMDYKEILKKLEELGISKYDFGSDKDIHIDDLGKIEIVDQAGSYGELQEGAYYMDFYIVRHFVEHDVYIKLDGEYYSYQGVEPGEYSEVKPHEEVRIVYK